MTAPTVATAIAEARTAGLERLDAQLLLGHALAKERAWIIAHADDPLDPVALRDWKEALRRRLDGEPLAYIVGHKDFHALRLKVDRRVLVPRPETEILVERGIGRLRSSAASGTAPAVLDLGTGSGAIALALKAAVPAARLCASDASPEALAVARENAVRLGLGVEFREGSWWEPWQGHRFTLVLSNPPYIASGDPHLPALRHEPTAALTSGADGLQALEAIIGGASAHLEVSGWLYVEHGHDQAAQVSRMLAAAGFTAIQTAADLSGISRCTGGRRGS